MKTIKQLQDDYIKAVQEYECAKSLDNKGNHPVGSQVNITKIDQFGSALGSVTIPIKMAALMIDSIRVEARKDVIRCRRDLMAALDDEDNNIRY